MAIITNQRVTEIVMLARTNGFARHAFTGHAAGDFTLTWSNATAQATLTITSAAGQVEVLSISADVAAPIRIWHAILDRLSMFEPQQAQAVGE